MPARRLPGRGRVVSAIAGFRRALRDRSALRLGLAFLLTLGATPATAQLGSTVSVWSQERLRGYSLSAGHPVARFDLSYDDPSGFYGAVSASAAYAHEYGLKPLDLQESIGFAK